MFFVVVAVVVHFEQWLYFSPIIVRKHATVHYIASNKQGQIIDEREGRE